MNCRSAGAQNAAQDAWSPDTFMTNWSKLSDPAKARMFGGKDIAQDINAIVIYADRLKQVGSVRNFSNTARNTIGATWLGAIGLQGASGDLEGAAKTAAMGGMAYGAGRLLMASPAFRQWMRGSMARIAANPNPQNVRTNVRRLSTIAARHPEIVPFQQQFVQRLEASLASTPVGVAAEEKDD